MQKLLLATRNPSKARELAQLLGELPFKLISLEEAGISETVEETGSTFEENAVIKAKAYVSLSGLLTLADDSGLEVDALGGRPGVLSARYGSPELSDEERLDLLLQELKDVPWEKRTARFRCVIALAWPSGEVRTVEGIVEGVIQYKPEGFNGFGYDPIFHLPDRCCTTAQLPTTEKNLISHRGQAARAAEAILKEDATGL
ncbi:MAG: XTP/dITP diphosphatase [Dehalococcoidia bacterium]|nr:XTP/dITP diphosphatase [Chloroflexota bacterium]